MESPSCMGLMAVMAVSGSVALVAVQLHRRLAAEFMEKVHLELGGSAGCRPAKKPHKKVRFAADVVEPSSNNEEYRRRAPVVDVRRRRRRRPDEAGDRQLQGAGDLKLSC